MSFYFAQLFQSATKQEFSRSLPSSSSFSRHKIASRSRLLRSLLYRQSALFTMKQEETTTILQHPHDDAAILNQTKQFTLDSADSSMGQNQKGHSSPRSKIIPSSDRLSKLQREISIEKRLKVVEAINQFHANGTGNCPATTASMTNEGFNDCWW